MDLSQAMKFFDKALELSKLCGDINQQCNTLIAIARLKRRTGDCYTAHALCTDAQRLFKLSANKYQEALALWCAALCSTFLGDYPASILQLNIARENLSLCGVSGGFLDYSIVRIQSEVHFRKSEYAEARIIYSQMAENTSVDLNATHHAYALLNIAEIDTTIGEDKQSVCQNLDNARITFGSLNHLSGIIYCDIALADLELKEGNVSSASSLFHKCLHLGWGKNLEITSHCLEPLADIGRWGQIKFQHKYKWPMIYLGYAHNSKDKLAVNKALLFLGDVFVCDKDKDTAFNLYTVALEGFTYMDVHRSRAQCMQRLGDLANSQGLTSNAIALWNAARPLFERSLQAKDVVQIDSRLVAAEQAH